MNNKEHVRHNDSEINREMKPDVFTHTAHTQKEIESREEEPISFLAVEQKIIKETRNCRVGFPYEQCVGKKKGEERKKTARYRLLFCYFFLLFNMFK